MGKTGLPVSASWMSMPVMPIMAARPLLRSAFSFQVLPRKSSSSPTCAHERNTNTSLETRLGRPGKRPTHRSSRPNTADAALVEVGVCHTHTRTQTRKVAGGVRKGAHLLGRAVAQPHVVAIRVAGPEGAVGDDVARRLLRVLLEQVGLAEGDEQHNLQPRRARERLR